MKKTSVTVACGNCTQPFETHQYRIKNGTGKYCSRDCYLESRWKRKKGCERCGDECQHRFCSEQCRKDHWNEHGFKQHKKPRNWARKLEIMDELGGQCSECGNEDYRVLDIDHIDASKKLKERKRTGNWNSRLKDWAANKGNLRLLCANCHRLRTWEQMGYGLPDHDAVPQSKPPCCGNGD